MKTIFKTAEDNNSTDRANDDVIELSEKQLDFVVGGAPGSYGWNVARNAESA